jgi:hypothetical protein
MIGEDKLLRFSGVPLGEACTLVLRGATQQILDEAERSIHDALCVLASTVKETRTVYGGGTILVFHVIRRAPGILPFYFKIPRLQRSTHGHGSICFGCQDSG